MLPNFDCTCYQISECEHVTKFQNENKEHSELPRTHFQYAAKLIPFDSQQLPIKLAVSVACLFFVRVAMLDLGKPPWPGVHVGGNVQHAPIDGSVNRHLLRIKTTSH